LEGKTEKTKQKAAAKLEKSQKEYDKHYNAQQEGLNRIKELQDKLSKTKKGSRERIDIQEKIKKEQEIYKGHEKEVKQKWPNGRPE